MIGFSGLDRFVTSKDFCESLLEKNDIYFIVIFGSGKRPVIDFGFIIKRNVVVDYNFLQFAIEIHLDAVTSELILPLCHESIDHALWLLEQSRNC